MTKAEFLNALRRSIQGLDPNFINETIAYYEDYIDTRVLKGQREEDVIRELGDPHLIAKSILASKDSATCPNEAYGRNDYQNEGKRASFIFGNKNITLPVWLFKLIIIAVIVLILIVVFVLLRILFVPMLIVFGIMYLVRLISRNGW